MKKPKLRHFMFKRGGLKRYFYHKRKYTTQQNRIYSEKLLKIIEEADRRIRRNRMKYRYKRKRR